MSRHQLQVYHHADGLNADNHSEVRFGNYKVWAPPHANAISLHKPLIRSFEATNVSSDPWSSGNDYHFRIDADSYHNVKTAALRFNVSESGGSNSIVLPPVPYFIDWIEFRFEGGTDSAQRIYADNFYQQLCFMNSDKLETLKSVMNGGRGWVQGETIPASGSRTYYLPLFGSILDALDIDGRHLAKDVDIVIRFRNTVLVSGSGTVQLDSMQLIMYESQDLTGHDGRYLVKTRTHGYSNNYVEFVQYEESGTFTASQTYKAKLENFEGICLALFFQLRSDSASSAATSDFCTKNYCLGNNCTVDIIDPSGQSLISNGTPQRLDYFQSVGNVLWNIGKFLNDHNIYVLPFTTNLGQVVEGEAAPDGAAPMSSEKNSLQLGIPAAMTNVVYTFNVTNAAPDGGAYTLLWGGHSTNSLAYNTSVANMKAAFDALPVMKDNGWTSTFSATAESDFTLTINTSRGHSNVSPTIKYGLPSMNVDTLNDGTVAEACTVTESTNWAEGFAGTGSYTLTIYALMLKRGYVLPNGAFRDEKL